MIKLNNLKEKVYFFKNIFKDGKMYCVNSHTKKLIENIYFF
jgi:hypothetical protein